MPGRRKLLLILLGAVLGLVALELVLQVAYIINWNRRSVPQGGGEAGALLCVGDSFTYGMGASSAEESYPSVAERLLQGGGKGRRVFNCGWPGSTSKDVLARLPRQLESCAPELVYVLVGYNDFWREPGLAAVSDAGDGFRWELRTLNLLRMIAHALSSDGEDEEDSRPPEFVGEWHEADQWMTFASDHSVAMPTGSAYWSRRGKQIVLNLSDRREELRFDWRIEDGRLVLESEALPMALNLKRGPLLRHDVDRARLAVREGRIQDAVQLLRASLTDAALGVEARRELVGLLAANGREGEVGPHLAALRERFAGDGSAETGLALAAASIDAGDVSGGLAAVGRMLRENDIDHRVVGLIANHGLRLEDPSRFRADLDAALARPDVPLRMRVALLGVKAKLYEDPVVAMRCLIEAYRADPDDHTFSHTVVRDRERFSAGVLDTALSSMEIDEAEERALRALHRSVIESEFATADVLGEHLRQIVGLVRAAGATPVLLTYPIEITEVDIAVRAVARETGAAWIDIRAAFLELLESADESEYFVLDGHCNDRGYAVIAAAVAADAELR